jgi:hypothetical protein
MSHWIYSQWLVSRKKSLPQYRLMHRHAEVLIAFIAATFWSLSYHLPMTHILEIITRVFHEVWQLNYETTLKKLWYRKQFISNLSPSQTFPSECINRSQNISNPPFLEQTTEITLLEWFKYPATFSVPLANNLKVSSISVEMWYHSLLTFL